MTEILQSPSQIPSPPSTIHNDASHQEAHLNQDPLFNSPNLYSVSVYRGDTEGGGEGGREIKRREREEGDQLSLLAVVVTVLRKSLQIACRSERVEDFCASSSMEIGGPTNVRHVAHVTFDRFNGFLGLPVEFEPEVPRRPPSASTRVFGVSTESMQLSFDSRGNSVPTILLMMQRRLYARGGLQAEGIFRINAENSQEEYVREQLNMGVVPDDVDVHCLAGLIKAWFRELPNGLLDSIPPEEVMQAQSEADCAHLARRLPSTEAALLDWAINLMSDVAQLENLNKMNARNIAMVFAPNMTQMADPLTALMHAVQVMNFLKTLIVMTLREREDSVLEKAPSYHTEPSDDHNGHNSSSQPSLDEAEEASKEEYVFVANEPFSPSPSHSEYEALSFLNSIANIIPEEAWSQVDISTKRCEEGSSSGGGAQQNTHKKKIGQLRNSNNKKGSKRFSERPPVAPVLLRVENSKGSSIVSRLNSSTERVEAWR
ncbi:Rho GTPase-activating protein [Actinidia chinensis var. chinensis]|uniref:Rho GTPase-activating protein n=1 Tax=Actinidia chinensis var. chinensis TaxID=1590841 RepID=A0A2R6R7S3_ACTCC|nr:Rho GTPase-activating protein [Actinidia chinensis var. chinensis]